MNRITLALALSLVVLPSCKTRVSSPAQEAAVSSYGAFPQSKGLLKVPPKPGRYVGFMKIADSSLKLPTVVDLVARDFDDDSARYFWISRIHLGGFDSSEYQSIFTGDLQLELSSGQFAGLPVNGQHRIASLNVADGMLSAELIGSSGDIEGHLELAAISEDDDEVDVSDIFPTVPIMNALTGEYEGTCGGEETRLQLEVARVVDRQSGLSSMRVTGRSGRKDVIVCGGADKVCTNRIYSQTLFNPVDAAVVLSSRSESKICRLSDSGLVCGENCALRKVDLVASGDQVYRAYSNEVKAGASRNVHFDKHDPSLVEEQISYFGYLHHRATNQYQFVSIQFNPKTKVESREPVLVMALHFGGRTQEFVAHRLELADSEEVLITHFEGKGEGAFALKRLTKNTLHGAWFSKQFGYVGDVVAAIQAPPLPEGAEVIPSLSGRYDGDGWEYEILASSAVSANSGDTFPLRVFGWAHEKTGMGRRKTISGGIFDFYTGSMNLILEDGRSVVGTLAGDGMNLFWPPTPTFGLLMGAHTKGTYVKDGRSTIEAKRQ